MAPTSKTLSNKQTANKIDVDALLAKRDEISNVALKKALDKIEARKQEEQEAQLISNLEQIQRNTKDKVEYLRRARQAEKRAKDNLVLFAKAEQEFYKTGDIEAYNLTIRNGVQY